MTDILAKSREGLTEMTPLFDLIESTMILVASPQVSKALSLFPVACDYTAPSMIPFPDGSYFADKRS
jgi:hypothetical protein